MIVLITGPRTHYQAGENTLPWMHITVDLPELPKPGEVIILNSGSSYYVKYIMWWIDGPENDAYWSHAQDYTVHGQYQTAHIVVDVDDRPERFGYSEGIKDGKVQGADELLAEMRSMMGLATSAGLPDGLLFLDLWLSRKEDAAQERKVLADARQAAADKLIADSYKAAQERQDKE